MTYFLLIVGFVLLTISANWLVDGASGLAKRLNISDLVIGLTVVAFGTSAPELVVNITSSIQGSNEIALTNILGSNIINTLVILGIAAVIYPVRCQSSTFKYEIPFSCFAGLIVLLMGTQCFGLFPNTFRGISRVDGFILLGFFILYLIYNVRMSRRTLNSQSQEEYKAMKIWKGVLLIIVGLAGLTLGGHLIVEKAILIAQNWGVPQSIIGVTIVSIGTSLPELATSAVAAYKKNTDLAIGNIIGSNIFNIFFVLSISSIIYPLKDYALFPVDAAMAAGSSLLLIILLSLSKKREISRVGGIILLLVYAIYLYILLKGI